MEEGVAMELLREYMRKLRPPGASYHFTTVGGKRGIAYRFYDTGYGFSFNPDTMLCTISDELGGKVTIPVEKLLPLLVTLHNYSQLVALFDLLMSVE